MNEKQMHATIAQACGWEWRENSAVDEQTEEPCGAWWNGNKGPWGTSMLPNYLNDLDAMHEAEKTLNRYERQAYCMQLAGLTGFLNSGAEGHILLITASATLRAAAFVAIVVSRTTRC